MKIKKLVLTLALFSQAAFAWDTIEEMCVEKYGSENLVRCRNAVQGQFTESESDCKYATVSLSDTLASLALKCGGLDYIEESCDNIAWAIFQEAGEGSTGSGCGG